jgi:PKD domain
VLVSPAQSRKQYRRYASSGFVEFAVSDDGTPTIDPDTLPPSFRFKYPDPQKPLRIGAALIAQAGATATWDPGDGTAILDGTTFEHEYARPGVYEVTLRIARGERLQEYLCEIALARDVLLELPLVAVPELIKEPQSRAEKRTIRARATFPSENAPQSRTATTWHVVEAPRARRAPDDGGASDPNEAVFDLPLEVVAGNRRLHLAYRAVRSQDVLFYSRQRYRREPGQTLHMAALNVATNRRYDAEGTQHPLNAAAKHFFGAPPTAVFSPVDTWSFELPLPGNGQQVPGPFSAPESKPGSLLFDSAQIEDLVLTLEYETRQA